MGVINDFKKKKKKKSNDDMLFLNIITRFGSRTTIMSPGKVS